MRRTRRDANDVIPQTGFEKPHVEILRGKIEEWPLYLQVRFHRYEGRVSGDNELLRIIKAISMLNSKDFPQIYLNPLQNYIENLRGNIRDTIYPECSNIENLYEDEPKNKPYMAKYLAEKRNPEQNAKESNSTSYRNSRILPIFAIVFALIAIFYFIFWNMHDIPAAGPNKIEDWTRNIRDLQAKFPSQNDHLWSGIVSGVKTIVTERPTKPSVLLLLHNDKRTSACLAREVGKEAVKLLSDTLQEPIIISGEDMKLNKSLTKDYGLFTHTYQQDIEKKHVMIIFDLQEIPAVLAQSFHVLCDVENPLVRDAAFLFTMMVDVKDLQHPTKIAEKKLNKLWEDSLDIDIRDPLITRITDAVVSVKIEGHLPC